MNQDDIEKELCKSIKSLSILKIIIPSLNSDKPNIKLIFVGNRPESLKIILSKLEKQEKLNDKERKELEKAIPFYERKFGTLDNFDVIFIYKYLEENMAIKHIKTILYQIIKYNAEQNIIDIKTIENYQPHNMLIYKYSRTIDYKYYINILNYIFENNSILDNTEFFNRLYKLTYLTKKEINNKIKTILPDKYKHISKDDEINFITHPTYEYNDYLYNDELYHLILTIPNIISFKYYYYSDEHKYNYYGYQNIDTILNIINNHTHSLDKHLRKDLGKDLENDDSSIDKIIRELKFTVEHNLTADSEYNDSLTLSYYNKTVNNEYYLIIKDTIKKWIPKSMIDFYYPDSDKQEYQNTSKIDKASAEIDKLLRLTTIKKDIYDDTIISNMECYCRNIIFESLSNKIINVKYNLENLYNNINTLYFLPVIKYFKDDEFKYIKINKKFLQNHDYQEINKLLIGANNLKGYNKFYVPGLNFLQFKWRLSNSIIISVNFYENGYSTIFFDGVKDLKIGSILMGYLKIVTENIKYIKKKINARQLILPNINNVFNEFSDRINYSFLLNGTIIINGQLNISKLIINPDNSIKPGKNKFKLELLIEKFRKYVARFHQFILTPSTTPNTIKLFYKQVNNFYSLENLENFMYNHIKSITDKGEKLDKRLEEKFIKTCKSIFMVDEKYLMKIYENIDNIQSKSQEKLLYGIEIEIKISDNGTIDIKFENVDKYYSIKKILFYIKSIFSNISNDISNVSPEITNTKIKSEIKSEIKSKYKHKSKLEKDKDDINPLIDDIGGIGGLDDFNFELDINLDIPTLPDDKLNKKIDEDMDVRDLARLIQMNELSFEDNKSSSDSKNTDSGLKNLELVKKHGKNKRLGFTSYMKNMRDTFDKQLFNPEIIGNNKYQYGRSCQASAMKQPYIVTKKDIESYDDPNAFNGYLKYRGNYYICPRIWDWMANKPISAKKFIENKLKSPYTNGTYILPDERTNMIIDDKHTVIIRKPSSNTIWEDPEKYPHWPAILKQTEKEAYPYLIEVPDHPQKLCIPCCGIKKPEDFDVNKKEIQQIYKPTGWKNCKYQAEEDKIRDQPKDGTPDILACTSNIDKYIRGEATELEKCRFGLVPRNLDIIINNHQYLFLNKTQNELNNNANLFLRQGIDKNKKENILETFSVIYKKSLQGLKHVILTKLTPEVFITLNNGELVDIFSSNHILPNTITDYDRFTYFIRNYSLFFNLLDIDYSILEKLRYKDIEMLKYHIEDNTNFQNYLKDAISSSKIKTELDDLKKLIIAYKIYSAFYNYLAHIIDEHEYKNYAHFLDLFSKPIEWLNKDGINILIFDKTCSKLICNPYVNITRSKFIILIQEDEHYFIPIVHVNNTFKNPTIESIFLYNKVNINDSTFNYYSKFTSNKKLLNLTKERENTFINLVILHSNICKYQNYENTVKFLKEIEELDIKPTNQIAFTTTQIEFIKLDKEYHNLVIPIYPMAINPRNINNKFTLLNNTILASIDVYVNMNDNLLTEPMKLLKNKMGQYGYHISKIFYDEVSNVINAIQFVNNLIIPVIPEKNTLSRQKDIIQKLINSGELKNNDDIRIGTLFRPGYFDFQIEMRADIDILNIRNLIYKDFIYNYFKYDFSRILQETQYQHDRKKIKELLINDNSKTFQSKNKNTFQNVFQHILDELYDYVYKIMMKRIRNSKSTGDNKILVEDTITPRNDYIKLKVCSKTKKQSNKCVSNFCAFDENSKQCYLDMNNKQLEYYSYLIANDLINNKIESRDIINGAFIPEFNMRNKIFRNPDEINININELSSIIENGIYSKYKKNITLSEYINKEEEYQFTKNDYVVLENTNMDQFKKMLNTIIPELVDLSIKNIFIDDKIFTTPFDKTGIFDNESIIGECKFPFFDKNKKKYVYQCLPRTHGVMCPTKLDVQRKPDKWGYCPEKIDETRKKQNIIDIDTVGDNKEYFEGKCMFPFIVNEKEGNNNEKHRLKYDCNKYEDGDRRYEWCPLRNIQNKHTMKNNKNSEKGFVGNKKSNKYLAGYDIKNEGVLLRSAESFDKVHINKWYDGKLTLAGITNKKYPKGYCQPPTIKTKKSPQQGAIADEYGDDDNLPEITLDNYVPNNCSSNITPSKGGYKRTQLVKFGVNYLKIPYTLMLKNPDTPLSKGDLCKLINNKYREIKKLGRQITDTDRLNAYKKDIDNCEDGNSKGGYSLKELREIGINYFDINEDDANEMLKTELCNIIRKRIKNIKSNIDTNKMLDKSKTTQSEIDIETPKNKNDTSRGSSIDSDKDSDIYTQKDTKLTQKEIENILGIQISKDSVSGVPEQYNMVYPLDINQCKETPKRGGPGSKEIKQIARDNFGINTDHKHKDQICDEIELKLKKGYKKGKKQGDTGRETRISASKISKVNFDELFEHPENIDIPQNINITDADADVDVDDFDINPDYKSTSILIDDNINIDDEDN